jgi:2'-hydroxyisoflavone reductase
VDVLVLGGSVFLGRAVVDEALALGANVTVFNRGISGPTPEGARQLTGDRTDPDSIAALRGATYDLVVDTSGYVPADVTLSAETLAPTCAHYAFVSSINVFPSWPAEARYEDLGAHSGNPDAIRADVPDEFSEAGSYGWLKAGCELAAQRAFGPERTSILRGGSIVGPHDGEVGRLPAWLARVARGGEVLVPSTADDPISLIDARDLAAFALRRAPGEFETAGPPRRDTRGGLMAACREATGSDARFSYVGDEWLAEQDVVPWTEIPLWAPDAPGLFAHDTAAAQAPGLTWRPLLDTVRDTWAWQRALPDGWQPTARTSGLAADKERELLARWHNR